MVKNRISVVIPLYKCAPFLTKLCRELKDTLIQISPDFEILFVNDGSPSNDWEIVQLESERDNRVKGINLSRNFGQHYAISAGISYSTGEWVIVMDGDLQDQPKEIRRLYAKAIEGFDIVLARRVDRKDSWFKRLGSLWFYKVLAFLTETEQNAEIANFGIYHRKVVDGIKSMNDQVKYFPAMVRWVGFKSTELKVEHAARSGGGSGYDFNRLLRLALSVILSFSDKPLRLTVKLGLWLSALAFIFAIYTFIRALMGQISVLGYSSLIISIWFLAGVVITLIGMLGLYIGRIFDQVKQRPVYLISETTNL